MRRGHGDRPGAGRRDRRHHPHVGRPRGHAERRRVRALRHLPPGHVRPDVRLRAVRLHHPRGVRGPGPGHHHLRPDHRGDLPRLHVPSWHPQHTQNRRHHDRPVRDRGAAPAVPSPDVRRLVSGCLLAVGTRRRQRHRGHSVPGRAGRRRVGSQRHQVLGYQRPAVVPCHADGPHPR